MSHFRDGADTLSMMSGMHADHAAPGGTELRSDLVDLTGLRLDEVDGLPHTALVDSLRRILREREQQPNSYQLYEAAL